MTYYYPQMAVFYCLFSVFFIFSSKLNAQALCQVNGGIITVTNTNDAGLGSLREAINCANESFGFQQIHFDIAGSGPHIIYVGSTTGQPLPELLDDGTTIDGTTQNGFEGDPQIILDGSLADWDGPYNALFLLGDYCEIYGLTIRYFPDDAIDLNDADHARIGAPEKGNVIYSNGIYQDIFPGFSGFWNGCGIVVRSTSDSCWIQGNKIGTNYDQTMDAGNEYCGIIVRNFCLNLTIGGLNNGEENIIANNPTGIRIDNSYNISIRKNSMYCNDTTAIKLLNNGNFEKSPPVIDVAEVNYIAGTAPENDAIDVFVVEDENCEDAPCQGKIYLGTAFVTNGTWQLLISNYNIQPGDKITATATTPDGTTSSFSECRIAVNGNNCAEVDGTIWVVNTDDDGPGTLRAAIKCANDEAGPNVIKFNIPDSTLQHRIYVGSQSGQELPALLDQNTTIDATTQPGFGVTDFAPKIVLDGSQNNWDVPINAIWIRGNYCEIYGLEIVNFPDDAIDVRAANFAIIGAPNKGNVIMNNGYETDFFPGLPNTGPWDGCGVVMRTGASFCTVQGNFIGTNYAQDSIAGNEYCGVIVQSNCQGNLIGGDGVGEENVIAYNELGVRISASSSFCRIQQNSMYCNDEGIELSGNGNQFQAAPTIDSVSVNALLGKGIPGDLIEVFVNDTTGCASADCQGKTFLGTTIVTPDSLWTLNSPYPSGANVYGGSIITATATDSMLNTSPFSNCLSIAITCNTFVINIENVQNETCGLINGSFEVVANGGFEPYLFDFGNGPTTESVLDSLNAGIYHVTVTDNSGCEKMDSIEILKIEPPVLSIIEVVHENCGQANGAITLSVSGGTPPYLFDIGNGFQTNPVFENLSAGTYPIIFTDATGCQDSVEITLQNINAPFLAVANVMNENCNMSDGSFTVIPFGGSPPFLYDIGNGPTGNPNFTGLSSGFYTVVVTDDFGCSNSISVVIFDAPPVLAIATNIVNATCGLSNGSFEVLVSSGIAPFSFDIGNGPTSNNVFTNLSAGNYQVTVTDFAGCSTIINAGIGSTGSPSFSIINIVNENCDQSDGSFEIVASGGVPPYVYNIGSGNTTNPVFSNLSSGIYNITVTGANGCSFSQVFTLGENEINLVVDEVINANCGTANGSISVSANGGVAPIFFDIGNGPTTNSTFSNLAGGIYNITVTDAIGCTDSQSITVLNTGTFTSSIINVMNENCGQADGGFEIVASGGTAPYTYDIGTGPTSNSIFSNLNSGTYNIIVTDAGGCINSQIFTLNENEVTLNIDDIINATCGLPNGSVTVSAAGGTPPFIFNLGNGATTNPVFENLAGGTYSITVTDGNGCDADQSVAILSTDAPTFSIINVMNENCGQIDGSFEISASGGTAPYTYNIGSGTMSNPVFTNLNAASYTVLVTDTEGCTASQIFTLNENEVALNIDDVTNATCGLSNGSITVSVAGGTAPFIFNLGNGATMNPVFENLTGGTYSITVTDGNGCDADQSVTILSTDAPTFSIINVMNENCGQIDGSFEISASGGTGPYTYNIGSGAMSNPIFTNLNAASYTVVVTDTEGCTASQIFTLDENEVTLNIDDITNATCGLSNGSITVSVTGGTPPYVYDLGNGTTTNPIFENLAGGTYSITVTDGNGCDADQSVAILSTGEPTFSVINVVNENCGQSNGSFEILATGGMTPYTYDIGFGAVSNPVFTNLNATGYNIVVTDAAGCTTSQVFNLPGNSITLNIVSTQNTTCGLSDGSITVSATGGTSPFLFDIGNGNTMNPVFENLSGGTYNITLTDDNGCTDAQSAIIENSNSIDISFSDIQPEVCGQMNGEFTVSASGGIAPYNFDIGNGVTNNNVFANLSNGSYTVTVTDDNGCQAIDDITIEGANSPALLLGDVFNETCNQVNGAISVIGSGGQMPYTYDFGNGPSNSNVAMNLSAGIYTVTLTDSNGCTEDLEVEVLNIGNPANASYTYNNNIFTVDFMSASADATSYSWDFGDGNSSTEIHPTHTYSSPGSYEVCLTVLNNCSSDMFCETITITPPNNVVFDLSNISGEAGDTVYVGIAVEDFDNMISFQKSIQMMDTTVAQFIGVTSLNLIDLSISDFTISNNTITADWVTNATLGQTVADGTIIYELAIKLLFKIDCSQIIIDGNPLPISIVQNINGTNISTNADVFDGEVCVTSGLGNTVEIAGLIFKENGQTVANVDVTCLAAPNPIYMTNSTGAYEFLDLTQGDDYTITPYKNDAPSNGLTALDLALIQQHVLGTTFLNSPYKIIAADANNSGTITALDLVAVQNVIIGNTLSFPNNTSWRFVPEDYVFPDPTNPFNPGFPEEITLYSLGADSLTENFIAIKIGDVNLTSTPSLNNDPNDNITFLVDYQTITDDEYLIVDFRIKNQGQLKNNQNDLLAWQMDLEYDPTQLIFEKIEKTSIPNFNENNIGVRFLEKGILPIVWVNPTGKNEEVISVKNEPLFSLKFKVKDALDLKKNLFKIKKDRMPNSAVKNGASSYVDVLLQYQEFIEVERGEREIISNFPNPFNEFTIVEFNLAKSEKVIFSIFDLNGKLVFQREEIFEKGENEIRIDATNLPNLGLFHYQLQTSSNQFFGKMIFIQ